MSGPAIEPITLAEAMAQAKVDILDEQDLMETAITAAREDIEAYLRRALITQTLRLTLDHFPRPGWTFKSLRFQECSDRRDSQVIYIPRPPLQSITSIKYVDVNGVQQTMAPSDFQVDILSFCGRIAPRRQDLWPYTALDILAPALNNVEVIFKAGYGDLSELVPRKFVQGVKLQFAHLFATREPVLTGLRAAAIEVPVTVEHLLAKDRVVMFG